MSEPKNVVKMPGVLDAVFGEMNGRIDDYIMRRLNTFFEKMDKSTDERYYPPIMSRTECKEYLHLESDAKLNTLKRKGLRYHKDGASIWYVRSEVDQFILHLPGGDH